ncbi:MAG: putative peptidoglycan glycosyltransferase FtsW [Hyphomicrobiaceae bacterium]
MTLARDDRSLVAEWWWTVNHQLLAAVYALMATGFVLSLAASPAVAERKGLAAYHFVERHAVFAVLGGAVVFGLSLMRPLGVRRLGLLLLAGALLGLVAVLVAGPEINGSQRWLILAGQQLQPSEIFKPAFVVVIAGLMAQASHGQRTSSLGLAFGLLVLAMGLLALEPDIGQAVLLALVWIGLFFLAGQPIRWIAAMAVVGVVLSIGAYLAFEHVTSRVDRFLHPASGDTYQMDRARESFVTGGWLGRGPGEGTIKSTLPDAHTDFIFAVIAEEYGVLACLLLLGLFAFIAWRALASAWTEPSPYVRLATSGLIVLISLQALINMGVNVGLLPAKGMTLPFISYGGSSLIGTSIAFGFLLALTRRRTDQLRPDRAPLPARKIMRRVEEQQSEAHQA